MNIQRSPHRLTFETLDQRRLLTTAADLVAPAESDRAEPAVIDQTPAAARSHDEHPDFLWNPRRFLGRGGEQPDRGGGANETPTKKIIHCEVTNDDGGTVKCRVIKVPDHAGSAAETRIPERLRHKDLPATGQLPTHRDWTDHNLHDPGSSLRTTGS